MTAPGVESSDPRRSLLDVEDLAYIKGVPFDAAIRFRQLLITGPPGAGKSSLVRTLGGWPDEGFLDLTLSRWWRSPVLTFRPREVHLGLPFHGQSEGLALFEKKWVEAGEPTELQLWKIEMPPKPRLFRFFDWHQRFVFEFLLPPAEKIFAGRQERAYQQTHHVDFELSLDQVKRQVDAYWQVAELFHREGLIVFVRDDHGAPPKRFDGDVEIVGGGRSRREKVEPVGSRSAVESKSVEKELAPPQPSVLPVDVSPAHTAIPADRQPEATPVRPPIVVREPTEWDGKEPLRVVSTKLDVRLTDLPVALELGPQKIEAHRDWPLDHDPDYAPTDVLLIDPEQYFSRVSGFVRLCPGDRTRIGKGEEDRQISLRLPRESVSPLEISNTGTHLRIVDLHSNSGTVVGPIVEAARRSRLPVDREERLARIGEIFGHPIAPLEPAEASRTLEAVLEQLVAAPHRPRDSRDLPGALVELPDEQVPIIVGDVHGNIDNVLKILSENRFLDDLKNGSAALIFLGDAVHREDDGELEEMLTSVTMMDLVFKLMLAFPGRVYYLQGNHDSFSAEVTKEGVDQGQLWRRALERLRGPEYVAKMQSFYDLSPVVVTAADFVACHAGPPQGSVSRKELVEIFSHPRLRHQITWSRLKRPGYPAGYSKRDVKVFKRSLGLSKKSALIVSHNPQGHDDAVWWNFGGIKHHHLVYSAGPKILAVVTRVGGDLVALTYSTERLLPRLQGDAEA